MAEFKELVPGGSSGDGMTIKQITFTDRPSAWEWLQSNCQKITHAQLSVSITPFATTYYQVAPVYDNTGVTKVIFSGMYGWGGSVGADGKVNAVELTMYYFAITDSETTVTLNPIIMLDGTNSETPKINSDAHQALPDSSWSYVSARLTVYYIE